jgi:hypothetical protein
VERVPCAPPCGNSCDPCSRPALVELNRDAFVIQDDVDTTVDLAGRHAASSLDDLDLDEPGTAPA